MVSSSDKYAMRFRELLLEYRRDKTQARWGGKLFDEIARREGRNSVANEIMISVQQDIDKDVWDDEDRAVYVRDVVNILLNWIEGKDPTPNNEYTQWLVQRYCDGGINLLEDMYKARDYLGQFHRLKTSGFFRRRTDDTEHAQWLRQMADINIFKTLSDLGSFVMDQGQQAISNAAQDRELKAKAIEESTILHDGPKYFVVIPESKEASQYWGRNTQWCTAAKENNLFDSYNEAPLYIIIDKKNNRRWQLYFEGYYPMFMDERDEPIKWNEFPADVWTAFDWPDEVFPTMIVTAMETPNTEARKAILRKLTNDQLITAFFWHDANKRKEMNEVIRERAGTIQSTDLLAKDDEVDDVDGDDDFEQPEAQAHGYRLGDLLILLASFDPNNKFLQEHEDRFIRDHRSNAYVQSGGVREAEGFEITVHSSRAAQVESNGRTWYCWGDGTQLGRISFKGIWCYSGGEEMRIGRGDGDHADRVKDNNIYDQRGHRMLDHQDAWRAAVRWISSEDPASRFIGRRSDHEDDDDDYSDPNRW